MSALRVWLGPVETAGVAAALRDGLRARGHDARLETFAPHPFGLPVDRVVGRGYRARAAAAARALARSDVLHLQFGTSLCELVDVALARVARRPLCVMHFWGDDCRTSAIGARLHPARHRVWAAQAGRDEGTVLRRLRIAGRVCAAALVSDLELASYVTPFFPTVYVLPTPVALPAPGPAPAPLPGEGPVVFHAPSDVAIKGTREIVAALQDVAARRPLRPRTVSGVPREQVLAEIERADVVVDQLNSETTGVFALEAMALGKPVLVEYDPRWLAPFARDTPAVRVTAGSLAGELETLCDDPARRAALGEAGRAFAARTHDARRVAALAEAVYADARRPARGLFEVTSQGIRPLPSSAA